MNYTRQENKEVADCKDNLVFYEIIANEKCRIGPLFFGSDETGYLHKRKECKAASNTLIKETKKCIGLTKTNTYL